MTEAVLSPDEISIVKRVLLSTPLQNLIGAEEWDLTEAEEKALWSIIKKFENDQPKGEHNG